MQSSRLNELMKKRDLSVNDISLIADVSKRHVNNWRNGHTPIPRSIGMILEWYDADKVSIEMMEDYIRQDILENAS